MQRRHIISLTILGLAYAKGGDAANRQVSHRFLVAGYDSLRYDFTPTGTIRRQGGPPWDVTEMETILTMRR